MTQHPIYIILDALDECPNTSGVRSPRDRVLGLVQSLLDLGLPSLHICVTSRPEMDIRICLEPLTSLSISLHDQTGHQEDITKYIMSEVDVVSNQKRWRDDDKELVIEMLSEKADGMFRWVYCQLEMLRLCLRSRVRQFINELPDSLDETYERVLKEIHKTNQDYAQRLLQCLTVAIRPLRVDELAAVLTFGPDAIEGEVPTLDADLWSDDQEQELLSACPSLITIVDSHGSRVVQFSHFSVKEFLTSDRLAVSSDDISRYHVLPEAAHTTLAQGALGVLLCLDDRVDIQGAWSDGWGDDSSDGWESDSSDGLDRWSDGIPGPSARTILPNPSLGYAAEHWVSHAQVGSVSSHVMGRMKTLFDSDKPHFAAWVQIHDIDRSLYRYSSSKTAKPLYYSALCGFCDLIEHLTKKHSQHVNDFGGELGYPLVAALNGGHIRAARLLFQLGANVDSDAVQFLLQHGADVNARQEDLSTPLHLAADWGDFESEGNCSSLVQLFLEHGAEVNSRDKQGSTALHHTLLRQGINVARLLLDHGADVNAEDNFGWTPLHLVSAAGGYSDEVRFSVAQLLIERGADVNARDKDHKTPLHFAWGLQLVRMLLDHGADVNAEDNLSRPPLHRMCEEYYWPDRSDFAQLLTERGADVNARGKDHKTALHLASRALNFESMRVLLDCGANVNAEDLLGQTPLHGLLVEHGADVNTQNKRCATLLHIAASKLNLESVRVFLDLGASANVKDSRGQTPLHKVLLSKHHRKDRLGIALLLIEGGANVNASDENHETPLHLASYFLELKSVRILLDHGADADAADNRDPTPSGDGYQTPLHQAPRLVSLEVAWILLKNGADLNAENKEGKTPFQLAQESTKEEMKRLPPSIWRARRAQCVALMGLLYGY
ncbi:ankyrin repeat-containing domain protein [Lactarius akahatsu]|uniref:Ankyrin repeat-containing domain protein n=1 Tax=Lactarius akahatsu TaxID=416441 RepID=A0AAD4Q405_9AGAM|nr:ankyrin repeat-containing domain protein [Lactarius akahatsu]